MLKKYIEHFSKLFDIDFNVYDVELKAFSDFQNTFCSRCPKPCNHSTTHLYGCYESVRWDNKYIYYCPMDFIFIAVPITNELNVLSTGVVAGPILMGDASDFSEDCEIPQLETSKVNDLAEIISAVFCKKDEQKAKNSTTDFLNAIYRELEILPENHDYPITLEKQLQSAIVSGEGEKAKELLNRLLGDIFFHSNGDFSVIKARALELLVILSRSAIEGGANIEQIFALNNNYINEIHDFETLEQLGLWLTSIINRFIGYVFEFGDVKHADIMHKIIAYIKTNYMKKITLDDVAEYVYMSRSYVSKIFNEEMNTSISSYINKVRIDKSKTLLEDESISIADIAFLVGFEDQSYFTKQFKALTGLSPKKFRDKILSIS